MFIVTIDGSRHVTEYYVPRLPSDIENHAGDPNKIYIDRSQFISKEALLFFKNNFLKFMVTDDGKLKRWAP